MATKELSYKVDQAVKPGHYPRAEEYVPGVSITVTWEEGHEERAADALRKASRRLADEIDPDKYTCCDTGSCEW